MSGILLGHSLSYEPKKNFLEFVWHVDNTTRGAADLGLRMGSHCAYVGPDRGMYYKIYSIKLYQL